MNDLRFAVRQLARTPAFTAAVVLTLALGLGVNASVFLVASDLFLRPLPVKDPRELVYVFQQTPQLAFPGDFSYPDYLDLRRAIDRTSDRPAPDMAAAFSGLLAYQHLPIALGRSDAPSERTWIAAVSNNFFEVLGVPAAHGRVFDQHEGRRAAADPIIVLTDACWRDRFGADPTVVGGAVMVNGVALTVVGVTPAGFHGAQWSDAVSGFVPATMLPTLQPGNRMVLDNRGQTAFHVMARLTPGTRLDVAEAAADVVVARLISTYPDVHAPARASLLPERMSRPAPKGSRFTIAIVTALVAGALLVLAVTIANVTNLLFARAAAREHELAVRGALGASRWRLLRPLVVESLLMAAAAGGAGLLLAAWATAWLDTNLATAGDVPPRADYGADWRVFAFTASAALFAGLAASVVPAVSATRRDVATLLRASAPKPPRHAIRSALVVGQVALACVVMVAAGLGSRSTHALAQVDPGFRSDHLLLASYDLGLQRYVMRSGLPRARRFHADVLDGVARLPGVRSASLAERVPLDVDPRMVGSVVGEGQPAGAASGFQLTPVHAVTHAFLETMGMPLVSGRGFQATDDENASRVAIISEALARRLWLDGRAVGRRISINSERPVDVVGVVGDGRLIALADPKWPAVYLPLAQNFRGGVTIVVRTDGDPLALAPSVERVVRELEPDLPVFNVRTMTQQVRRSPMGLMPLRFGTTIVAAQGLLALALALTGIYGLVTFAVARRTKEIGLRMALGATSITVMRLVAAQSVRLAVTGLLAGLPLALLAVRPLANVLVGVAPADPLVIAGVAFSIIAVALAACWLPARRATRVNPLDALRTE